MNIISTTDYNDLIGENKRNIKIDRLSINLSGNSIITRKAGLTRKAPGLTKRATKTTDIRSLTRLSGGCTKRDILLAYDRYSHLIELINFANVHIIINTHSTIVQGFGRRKVGSVRFSLIFER